MEASGATVIVTAMQLHKEEKGLQVGETVLFIHCPELFKGACSKP